MHRLRDASVHGVARGCDRSSVRCIASRAVICITNRIRYAIATAYWAASPGMPAPNRSASIAALASITWSQSARSPASSICLRRLIAVLGGEPLPFDREGPVTL